METYTYVYLLFCQCFPDTDLVGVFSTEEKARDMQWRKKNETFGKNYHFFIEKTTIDEEFNGYR